VAKAWQKGALGRGVTGALGEAIEMLWKIRNIKRFLADKEGVTLIEYCLIAALIAIVSLIILTAVGTEVSAVFSKINSALSSAAS
jgi:pilus assembly protein Flp/PilA